jgi:transcriptional regulator with XRE-family HTH domain
MTDTSSPGDWIRQRRKELGLSQTDLAERVNCAYETIRKIEAGARRPSADLARALATALEIPPDRQSQFIELARLGSDPP